MVNTREGMIVPTNPPAYDPRANGAIEKGVQDWNASLRCLELGLEAKIGCTIPTDSAVMEWMMQHAGYVHARFQIGHDGKAPQERLTGRVFS